MDQKSGACSPALIEVGQHVMEGHLHELKSNAEGPQHGVVADDERLAPPAQRMRHDKLIKDGVVDDLPVDALAWYPEPAITAVRPLRELGAQL